MSIRWSGQAWQKSCAKRLRQVVQGTPVGRSGGAADAHTAGYGNVGNCQKKAKR